MSKNLKTFSLLFLSVFSTLFSCNFDDEKNVQNTPLVFGSFLSEDFVEINYDEFKEKTSYKDEEGEEVGNKENFMIVCYANKNCLCYSRFKNNVIVPFIKKTHATVYLIKNSLFEHKETYGLDLKQDRETFAIFRNGKLEIQKVYSESNNIWYELDAFENWINDKITLPTIFYISKEQLDAKYNSNDPFTVMIGRASCGDCAYVYKNELVEYSKSNKETKPLYIYNADEIYENQDNWSTFKEEYGLASSEGNNFGYATGYVPSFLYIEPNGQGEKISTIKSMCVIFNDTIEKVDNKYIIKTSFFNDSMLEKINYTTTKVEGKEIGKDEVEEINFEESVYIYWDHKFSRKVYDPILTSFLDKYLK